MRKSSNLFLFFTMSCIADPFYGDVTKNRDKVIIENNVLTENITPCALPNTLSNISLPVKFEQLKLIGVLKKGQQAKAILINDKKQIFYLKVNDFLLDEHIQITRIDLKSLHYIDWHKEKDCQHPKENVMKL
ncbi:hypothetical protein [[Haemophilus] ducreyi]|uniref:hypothetical protein n=1 Tax=Haemophilus ducreyi TaxID=730 RepID=UPI000655E7CC|nr:hypothetical protein [[Haemophilus] ducreyi]AKO49135.1 hypothetical protein RZ69_01580 [[Haemophilus] ducreyi]OOS03088.1 hypothetical protein B0190_06215 [[Haemophilus] ducreyi]SEV91066.1 hypothetical protein SAMN02983000_0721 [[Haemophilus] ducreyi]VEG83201.1 Uncharacterised protein [[Haemophilus] ducreyi]